jgi:hypothetical protein
MPKEAQLGGDFPAQRIPSGAGSPIGVFDSGVGGLTVLHELLVSLPAEDYIYLGDTARFPYGERSQTELRRFAIEIADHLLEQGAKLLVVACNAASSAALETLEQHLEQIDSEIDVIGVVGAAPPKAAGSGCWPRPQRWRAAPMSSPSGRPIVTCTWKAWRVLIWRRSSNAGFRSTSTSSRR